MDAMNKLIGSTVIDVTGAEYGSEEMRIVTDRGTLRLFHEQDCCESVQVEDVTGYPPDLIGGVVVVAEERTNEPESGEDDYGTRTWTFYTIRTTKGDLDLRWLGQSNGYYSESVAAEWLPAVDGK